MSRILPSFLFLLVFAQSIARAQTGASSSATLPVTSPAVAASAEDSRLRQMELIYQQQLRVRHIPLLGKYLTDLQKMSATSASPAYKSEMERVQAVISAGGVIDLSAAVKTLTAPGEMPMPSPMPPPKPRGRPLVVLTPALARTISPTPTTSSSPDAAAMGEMEWRLDTLPAGTYDLVLQYACTTPGTGLGVRVDFANEHVETVLTADQATPTTTTYHLLRLGQISLPNEVRGESLRIRAGDKTSTSLLLRQLIVSKPRPNDP